MPLGINKRSSYCSEEETGPSALSDRPSTAALDATRIACNTACLVVSSVSTRSGLRTPGRTNEIGGLTPSGLPSRPSLPSSPPASFLVCYPRRYLLAPRQRPVSPLSPREDRSPCRCLQLSERHHNSQTDLVHGLSSLVSRLRPCPTLPRPRRLRRWPTSVSRSQLSPSDPGTLN